MANGNRNGSLYLFMHGLFAMARRGDWYEVVLPDVPGHVQRAGTFLAESNIAYENVMRLRGVTPGTADFISDGIVDLPDTSLTDRKRAATLWLRLPNAIFYMRRATPRPTRPPDPADYVVKRRDGSHTFNERSVATVVVLVYDYQDENEVRLQGHYWEPCPVQNAISLHIISTSETPETLEHEEITQDVMAEVLRGYPGLTFKRNPRPLAAPWVDPRYSGYGLESVGPTSSATLKPVQQHLTDGTGNYAFLQAELEYPAARAARLARLGRMIESPWAIASAWHDPDALSDQLSNCFTLRN